MASDRAVWKAGVLPPPVRVDEHGYVILRIMDIDAIADAVIRKLFYTNADARDFLKPKEE